MRVSLLSDVSTARGGVALAVLVESLAMSPYPRSQRRKTVRLTRRNSCCDPRPDGTSAILMTVPQGRRAVLKAALGLGLCFSFLDGVPARAEDPRMARPQEGDRFVFPSGDREGQLVTPADLPLGGPQQLAYPMDPRAKIVRNGSTLNLVALLRFDPAELTEET